jgi:hypothetical protein
MGALVIFSLPNRITAVQRGWTHQVDWFDNGRPGFMRFTSAEKAADWAEHLIEKGMIPVIVDLREALGIN